MFTVTVVEVCPGSKLTGIAPLRGTAVKSSGAACVMDFTLNIIVHVGIVCPDCVCVCVCVCVCMCVCL